MAWDVSHLQNHISLNLDRLQDAMNPDPVEFTADEDINRPEKGSKESEELKQKNTENKKTKLAHSPYLQLPISLIMSSLSSIPQQVMTKQKSCIVTAT